MRRQWFDDVLVPNSVVATPAAAGSAIYQAKDFPEDEASQRDERYHDGEASIYDTYCLSPRVAVAEKWIVPWLCEQARGVVVDLGCGTGRVAEALTDGTDRAADRKVVAIDRSLRMLEQVRAKLNSDDLFLLRSDARAMPLRDSSVDTVICSGVLHHMPAWPDAIREIGRVLKAGGRLLVREPNGRYPEQVFAPFESALQWVVDNLNRKTAPPATGDSTLSPVERPVLLAELTRAAGASDLRLHWSGSAMMLGSLGIPDEVPLQNAYFTAANLVDRLAMRVTRHPYGALVLAVYIKSPND